MYIFQASNIKAKLTGDDTRWPDGLQWVVTDRALPEAPIKGTRVSGSGGDGSAVSDGASPGVSRSSLAFLQYTSGSTGDPKGVKITHGNLAHNLSAIMEELKAGEDTVVVSWLPQVRGRGGGFSVCLDDGSEGGEGGGGHVWRFGRPIV